MGNQREIRQTFPEVRLGVAIEIRNGALPAVKSILNRYKPSNFYTSILPAGIRDVMPNLDFGNTIMEPAPFARLTIQSGGKMWCGYDEFRDHIAELAPHLHNATFFVRDDHGDIDEFRIIDGMLLFCRVCSDCCLLLDEFLIDRFPGIVFPPE